MTPDELVHLCRTEPSLQHTSSLLVAVDGVEVAAYDLHGIGLDEPVPNVASIGKSLLATVVGWAWQDGLLSLESTLHDLLGDAVPVQRRAATVHHLLSMTSGAEPSELWQEPHGWAAAALRAGQRHTPGSVFDYDNGAVHLLAVGVQRAVGGDLRKYATERGLEFSAWKTDPEGVPWGFGGVAMTPRAMLRFGESWRTGAAVAPSYRDRAWTAHTLGNEPIGHGYGYLWWICPGSFQAAIGYAGQAILITERTTVVVTGDRPQWRDDVSRLPLTEIAELAGQLTPRGVTP